MVCAYCGGLVLWRGPLSALTHTQCEQCGRTNCQEVEINDETESEDGEADE